MSTNGWTEVDTSHPGYDSLVKLRDQARAVMSARRGNNPAHDEMCFELVRLYQEAERWNGDKITDAAEREGYELGIDDWERAHPEESLFTTMGGAA